MVTQKDFDELVASHRALTHEVSVLRALAYMTSLGVATFARRIDIENGFLEIGPCRAALIGILDQQSERMGEHLLFNEMRKALVAIDDPTKISLLRIVA